jgi:hypothetical protein
LGQRHPDRSPVAFGGALVAGCSPRVIVRVYHGWSDALSGY